MVARRRDARPRAPGKCVSGAAARHRLSGPGAGRLLLRRTGRRHRLSQRHARQLAGAGLGIGRVGRPQARRSRLRRRPRAVDDAARRAGRREDRGARPPPQKPPAPAAAGASRTLVLTRARDHGSDPQRAAEVRFMRFFHHTPMAIATIDRDGGIVRTNALFARLFQGLIAGGKESSVRAIVAQRDWPALEAAIGQAAQGKGDIAPVDAMLAGNEERFGRFYVTAVGEQERDPEAAIVYALETTEQRALESKLMQQQKMDSIGQFAGGMAHDFNNMLNAIILANDFLLNAHKPTDPSFNDIMEIRQSANRAASLVRHLLAFSRKQTLRPQVLDLGEVLSDLTVVLRRLIGAKITLKVVHGRDLWPVRADLVQFEQVITNLAINARDAMPDGGQLELRSTNVSAQDSARYRAKGMPAADYVLVEVAANGR